MRHGAPRRTLPTRVQGTLNRIEGGCTEAGCDNICRDSIAIGDGALGRESFVLIDDGSGRFECTRSVGDPCDGHEPPEMTMPCCRLSLDGGEVVATATVRDWDGRGGIALDGATLCRL